MPLTKGQISDIFQYISQAPKDKWQIYYHLGRPDDLNTEMIANFLRGQVKKGNVLIIKTTKWGRKIDAFQVSMQYKSETDFCEPNLISMSASKYD